MSPEIAVAGPETGSDMNEFPVSIETLCSYYLDCLSHDDQGGVRVFAQSKYGKPDFAELTSFSGYKAADPERGLNEACRELLGRVRRDRSRLTTMIGYPVNVVTISGKNGWQGQMLEPLFLFAVAGQEPGGDITLASEAPDVNSQAIKSLTGVSGSDLIDEVIHFSEILQLGESPGLPDLVALGKRLAEHFPAWEWREPIDPHALGSTPALSAAPDGLYNRAILITVERSPYVKGLIAELAKLKGMSTARLSGTALANWMGEPARRAAMTDEPILEVLPLNTEQREAVRRSLSEPLTVITGPPGTGKSQVVSSILMNAAWKGQRVLFASKNNRAVDVVEQRVNSLGARPVLLRLGSGEYQSTLALHLSALLSMTASTADVEEYESLTAAHLQLVEASSKLNAAQIALMELRNGVDTLDRALGPLRATLGDARFSSLRSVDLERARLLAKSLDRAVTAASKDKQGRVVKAFWRFLRERRFETLKAVLADAREAFASFGMSLSNPQFDDKMASAHTLVEEFVRRVTAAASVKEYFVKLGTLGNAVPFEKLAVQHAELSVAIARNSSALWKVWLRIQPSKLTKSERDILAEYVTIIQLLASLPFGSKGIGPALQKHERLFPQLVKFFSCWAVTSLSAKGRLPLEPGFFDLVVVDEASQCDIASALPLLFRAKRAVIIGDPNQLKHISALGAAQDNQLMAKHSLMDTGVRWSYSVNSLYDRAVGLSHGTDIISLRDHHRSHSDIIDFSNEHFYNGSLRVATRHDRLVRPIDSSPAVRWQNVTGRCERPTAGGAVNRSEAKGVVDELERLLLQQNYRGTVGVVTPFRAQANYIRDLVNSNDRLVSALMAAEYLVDTVHRFQGDERDVIIFSPAVAQGVSDGALMFLKRSPHLFNVAITRARASLIVVGDKAAAGKCGVDYLEEYAKYVDSRTRPRAPIELTRPTSPEYPKVAHPDRVSDWERLFFSAMWNAGLRPIPQYQEEKYQLDFALIEGDRRLNVEVDGERYHRSWDGELVRRDQLRNQRLLELGWDVKRFWVYQLREDMPTCVEWVRQWVAKGASTQPLIESIT